jgi:hypothetical protein
MNGPKIHYWTTSKVSYRDQSRRNTETGVMVEAATPAEARRAARALLRDHYPNATIKILTAEPAPERFQ